MFGGGFPFGFGDDDFGGIPGMGGMGGGSKEPVNTTEFYEVLGVPKDAEPKAIKRAYHKIAMKEHPDRGGDAEKFKKAQQAYEVLSKPEKRKLYDKGGMEMVERGEARGSTRRQRTRDVVRPLPCTLEEVYNGKTRKFAIHRTVLCKTCTGSGCKAGRSENHCDSCNGRGVKVMVRRMGPMIQQMQVACEDCRGQGTSIAPEDKCPDCAGKKLNRSRERKVVEVVIEKGMTDNTKITLRGMADEAPGKEAGDLVFVLQMKKHAVFKRRGADLYMDKDVTLLEALTGVKFVLEHMDGHKTLISTKPGEIIGVDALKAVRDLGMPLKDEHFTKGNLFIRFNIVFPENDSLTPQQLAVLKATLPGPAGEPVLEDDMEEVAVATVNLEAEAKRSKEVEREAYDESDEDDERGGGGVRCAQQ